MIKQMAIILMRAHGNISLTEPGKKRSIYDLYKVRRGSFMKNSKITSYILLSAFTIFSPLTQSAMAACDSAQCTYSVSLDKAGFYVPIIKLPVISKEGFWGLTLNTSSGFNMGGFNAGGVLGENAMYPGFIGFYLAEPEEVTLSAYEYTGNIPELTVSIRDSNQNFVLSPSNFASTGVPQTTPVLDAGFYVATVFSRSADPRGRFGLSLSGNNFSSGVNVGGWIDSYTGGSGDGFGGIFVDSPQTVNLTVLFGNTYGDAGAGMPEVEIYYQEPTGQRTLQWSSSEENKLQQDILNKVLGNWKFRGLDGSYGVNGESNVSFTGTDLVAAQGTDDQEHSVYVEYDSNLQRYYFYYTWYDYSWRPPSSTGHTSIAFWFHFVSDNSVAGCVLYYDNNEGSCTVEGVRS